MTVPNRLFSGAVALLTVITFLSAHTSIGSASAEDVSVSVSVSVSDVRAQMDKAYASAVSYETAANYTFAHISMSEYADCAKTLSDAGELHPYISDTAAGWRDYYSFSPELYGVLQKKLFMGSDGYFADGADAVRLNIPYGYTEVEDYYHLIPATNRELCVLVYLTVSSEGTMRNISQGKDDEYLERTLRQISRIEGQVYLAFCPAVNTRSRTKTLDESFISAFRYVSSAARRYAPNVHMVYSLGDTTIAGEDTVAKFYPGDAFVDAFGVELVNDYSRSHMPSPEAAYDRRGEYYDPVWSVKVMADRLADVTDKTMPLLVTGCSFPWEGDAAVEDYAAEMRNFYDTLPRVCPELTAIFYSNESSAAGICNLRQNADAAALYEELLSLPRVGGALLDGTFFPEEFTLYTYGAFRRASFKLGYSSAENAYASHDRAAAYNTVQAAGNSTPEPADGDVLTVYVTENYCKARLEYRLTVTDEGVSAVLVPPAIDYNGNGFADFSDVDLLTAYVARWDITLNGVTDLNGDGKTNLKDVNLLRSSLDP